MQSLQSIINEKAEKNWCIIKMTKEGEAHTNWENALYQGNPCVVMQTDLTKTEANNMAREILQLMGCWNDGSYERKKVYNCSQRR